MEFFLDYAAFLAKTATVAVAVVAVPVTIAALRGAGRRQGRLKVTRMNKFYGALRDGLEHELLTKKQIKQARKHRDADSDGGQKIRIFVLDFKGDTEASAAESLRHEVTALLGMATAADEVVLRLESPGGAVHGYGLASSHLARIRAAGIPLTVCVDKVAASGGYMMACLATKIVSAPFAYLGSIGVVATIPNIHRLLKRHNVDVEMITAGESKRTLTLIGENTDEGREKYREKMADIHQAFKGHVSKYRPQVDIPAVATGDVWLGEEALVLNLVDELGTSDAYLCERAKVADLVHLQYIGRRPLRRRAGAAAAAILEAALQRLVNHKI